MHDDPKRLEGVARMSAADDVLRRRVQAYLQSAVLPRDRQLSVLEIGCRGENAVFVARLGHRTVATNCSDRLLERARALAGEAGLADEIAWRTLDARKERPSGFEGRFDLMLADFGALNRLEPAELKRFGVAATSWVRAGGRAVFLVMPPVCAWQAMSKVLRGRWLSIGRRPDPAPAGTTGGDEPSETWYHAPDGVREAFGPGFEVRHLEPLGLALPPFGDPSPVAGRAPVLNLLAAAERIGRLAPGLARFSDHYLIDLQRTPAVTLSLRPARLASRRPRFATEPMGRAATRARVGTEIQVT